MKRFEENKVCVVPAGNVIFEKGETADFTAMILKGSVDAQTSYGHLTLQSGDMIGIFDVCGANYVFDYIAHDDVTLCPLYISNSSKINSFFSSEKKYIPFAAASAIGQAKQIFAMQQNWFSRNKSEYSKLKVSYEKYKNFGKKFAISITEIKEIEKLSPEYESFLFDKETASITAEISALPFETVSSFFGQSPFSVTFFLQFLGTKVKEADLACRSMETYFETLLGLFAGEGDKNLFVRFFEMAQRIEEVNGDDTVVKTELTAIAKHFEEVEVSLAEYPQHSNPSRIERIKDLLSKLSNEDVSDSTSLLYHYSSSESERALSELEDLTEQILDYSDWDKDRIQEFLNCFTAYKIKQKDHFVSSDSAQVCKEFETQFYELYEAVFLESQRNRKPFLPAVTFFLDYGILDEKEYSQSEMVTLFYRLQDSAFQSQNGVYTMSSWLRMIYSGEREPSKDELGRDYKDSLLEIKKKRTVSMEEEREYLGDAVRKVRFEIHNFFRINNKIVHGGLSSFTPYAAGNDALMAPSKCVLSSTKVQETLNEITKVDYALFYREYTYHDDAHKIDNVRILTQVMPDIILIPNSGARGSMWQEIEGRRRVSHARFVLPIYPQTDLYDMLLSVSGRYRWEFCRTEQGTRWNDITDKSLTAEYCDYIQFYKKNNDLSDIAKVKLRDRITSHRNNTSELFISDYISWVKYESAGSSRLNKISREILSEYCLFAKNIRLSLASNPMFGEVLERKENKLRKKEKEISNYIKSLQNSGHEATAELMEYLNFFRM